MAQLSVMIEECYGEAEYIAHGDIRERALGSRSISIASKPVDTRKHALMWLRSMITHDISDLKQLKKEVEIAIQGEAASEADTRR